MPRGAFILFEGLDRCGKTTQARLLVERLHAAGRPAVFMRFPDRDTKLGSTINAYLTKEVEVDDHAIHLIFSANRWERRSAILSALLSGTAVIVDRYAMSGAAYSSAKCVPGMTLPWCMSSDEGLPAPDVTLFMHAGVSHLEQRADFGGERYESVPFLSRVAHQFQHLAEHMLGIANKFTPTCLATSSAAHDAAQVVTAAPLTPVWVNIDALGSIPEVSARVDAAIAHLLPSVEGPIRRLWDAAPLDVSTLSVVHAEASATAECAAASITSAAALSSPTGATAAGSTTHT